MLSVLIVLFQHIEVKVNEMNLEPNCLVVSTLFTVSVWIGILKQEYSSSAIFISKQKQKNKKRHTPSQSHVACSQDAERPALSQTAIETVARTHPPHIFPVSELEKGKEQSLQTLQKHLLLTEQISHMVKINTLSTVY